MVKDKAPGKDRSGSRLGPQVSCSLGLAFWVWTGKESWAQRPSEQGGRGGLWENRVGGAHVGFLRGSRGGGCLTDRPAEGEERWKCQGTGEKEVGACSECPRRHQREIFRIVEPRVWLYTFTLSDPLWTMENKNSYYPGDALCQALFYVHLSPFHPLNYPTRVGFFGMLGSIF